VRFVLGDTLGHAYTIHPQVTGAVTFRTPEPVTREAALGVLETLLRANGAILVRDKDVFSVVPAAQAGARPPGAAQIAAPGPAAAGFATDILTLRFVAAAELVKVLGPLTPPGATISADAARNMLLVTGTAAERDSIRQTVTTFDVDYLRSMSFALIRPKHVEAAKLSEELRAVVDRPNSLSAGMIQFVPLPRINAVLVIAPRAAHLQQAVTWSKDLDVPPAAPMQQLFYYRLQNSKAQDIAPSLAALWGGVPQQQPPAPPSAEVSPAGAALPPPLNPILAQGGSQGPQIVLDEPNNAIIIRATRAEYEIVARFLQEVDVTPDQVLIEATIVEVTLNENLRYGVEWLFKSGKAQFNLSQTGVPKTQFPGFAFSYVVPDASVVINALDAVTDVNVVSSPKVLTLNNRPATLQAGDQVPVIVQSATSVVDAANPTIVNSVQFRDTGVVLKVTPRIGKGGAVFIDISQEVSDAVPTITSGIDSPTIQQRRIASSVAIQDGETVALGGMIRSNVTTDESGVPVLKDVPVFGNLFKSTEESQRRTELLIFIRPQIIRSGGDARAMTEDLKAGLVGLQRALGGGAAR
jgi:general secretion pathway protein D